MMKRIISLIIVAASVFSLAFFSVFAAPVEVNAPNATVSTTTVALTISEDYIPSEESRIYINPAKIQLKENLIDEWEYKTPKNKDEASAEMLKAQTYIQMIYELLPPVYNSSFAECYLIAQTSIINARLMYNQYHKDYETFIEQELIAAQKAKEKAEREAKEKAEREAAEKNTQNNANTKYLGRFKLTAYCNCSKCCGKWAGGPTKSGTMPKQGRTIAVDPKIISLGSKVIINGITYTAEDTGSSIKNKRIDVYFDSHKEALNFGVKYADVYVVTD